jgi:SAM-dependent methyltransferase
MQEATIQKLLELNREFYQTFAVHFSTTRMRIQPGVAAILDKINPQANILDLGCGNGVLAQRLSQIYYKGHYVGLDSSPELLEIARTKLKPLTNFTFFQGDLADGDWDIQVRRFAETVLEAGNFDMVTSFATIHHLPGNALRKNLLNKISTLLTESGRLIHSNWQFLNSERLRKRIQPWDLTNIAPEKVDPGDFLLDWRQGGKGLRYVHHFNEDELASLAEETGFHVLESYLSDGEGGNLGLYQVWEKIEISR